MKEACKDKEDCMAKAESSIAWAYDVHPGLAMYQSVFTGMKHKTGRSLDEWIQFVEKEGPTTEKERRDWLKSKHGLGTNYAWRIAERSVGNGDDGDPATYLKSAAVYVEKMF